MPALPCPAPQLEPSVFYSFLAPPSPAPRPAEPAALRSLLSPSSCHFQMLKESCGNRHSSVSLSLSDPRPGLALQCSILESPESALSLALCSPPGPDTKVKGWGLHRSTPNPRSQHRAGPAAGQTWGCGSVSNLLPRLHTGRLSFRLIS